MKFNQALIAAVAASAMLMSPVFAQGTSSVFTSCAAIGREDGTGTATAADQCGSCKPSYCAMDDTTTNSAYECQPYDPATQQCKTAAPYGNECKATHVDFGGKCLEQSKFNSVNTACDSAAQKAGKHLKLNQAGDAVECVCEHGLEKVNDANGTEIEVCKCADSVNEVRNLATSVCAARPDFNCTTIGRKAVASAKFASACGECEAATDCHDSADASYKCVAASDAKGTQCNNSTKVLECKDTNQTLNGDSCLAPQTPSPTNETATDANEGQKEGTVEKVLTDDEKCAAKNREYKDNKCGDCKTGYNSPSKDGDYMCFLPVNKDACEKNANTTHRFFETKDNMNLCLCKAPKKAAKAEEVSSIDAVCINGAGQLVISSMVVLSSVLASALFFL